MCHSRDGSEDEAAALGVVAHRLSDDGRRRKRVYEYECVYGVHCKHRVGGVFPQEGAAGQTFGDESRDLIAALSAQGKYECQQQQQRPGRFLCARKRLESRETFAGGIDASLDQPQGGSHLERQCRSRIAVAEFLAEVDHELQRFTPAPNEGQRVEEVDSYVCALDRFI
jgi:hypothetical protein